MAKRIWHITFPDGTTGEKIVPEHVDHKWAVIGRLRLRRRLTPEDPNNPDAVTDYERFEAWVLLGTFDTERQAEATVANPVFPQSTLESLIVPVTWETHVSEHPRVPPRRKSIIVTPEDPFVHPPAPARVAIPNGEVALEDDGERLPDDNFDCVDVEDL